MFSKFEEKSLFYFPLLEHWTVREFNNASFLFRAWPRSHSYALVREEQSRKTLYCHAAQVADLAQYAGQGLWAARAYTLLSEATDHDSRQKNTLPQ